MSEQSRQVVVRADAGATATMPLGSLPVLAITPEQARSLVAHNWTPRRAQLLDRYRDADCWSRYLISFSARFWSKVASRDADDCWLWLGGRTKKGYGLIAFEPLDIMLIASRMALVMSGSWIERPLASCHTCDNPPCANPHHLFIGTRAANVRDMHEKGRYRRASFVGEQNGRALLTVTDVHAIRSQLAAGVGQKRIADSLGVRPTVVWRIAHRITWGHLT